MKPELVLTSAQKKRRFEKHHNNLKLLKAINNTKKPSTKDKSCYDSGINTYKPGGETGHYVIKSNTTPPEFGERRNKRKLLPDVMMSYSKLPKHDTQSEGTRMIYPILIIVCQGIQASFCILV